MLPLDEPTLQRRLSMKQEGQVGGGGGVEEEDGTRRGNGKEGRMGRTDWGE